MANLNVAMVRGTAFGQWEDALTERFAIIGIDYTEVGDGAVGSHDFSPYDAIITLETGLGAADIEGIAKPTLILPSNTVGPTGITQLSTLLGITDTVDKSSSTSSSNGWGLTYNDDGPGAYWPLQDYIAITGTSIFAFSYAISSGGSFIGNALSDGLLGDAGKVNGVIVESGVSRLTTGVTWDRIAWFGWPTTAEGGFRNFNHNVDGMFLYTIAWLTGREDEFNLTVLGSVNDDFNGEVEGTEPSRWTKISGTGTFLVETNLASNPPDGQLVAQLDTATAKYGFDDSEVLTEVDYYVRLRMSTANGGSVILEAKDGKYGINVSRDPFGNYDFVWLKDGGTLTSDLNIPTSIPFGAWVWTRLKISNETGPTLSRLQFKIWIGSKDDEPASWVTETTDTGSESVSGQLRVQLDASGSPFPAVDLVLSSGGVLAFPPETPVVTIDEDSITATAALVQTSPYVAGDGGGSHFSSTYTVKRFSDDVVIFSKTVSDPTKLEELLCGPLPPATTLYAEVIHTDSFGIPSEPGVSDVFSTIGLTGCFVPAGTDDDANLWTRVGNTAATDPWANYTSVGNPLDGLLVAIQQGSLGGPRCLVTCQEHDQTDVRGYGGFDGEIASTYYAWYKFGFNRFQGIEWSSIGLCALASGEIGVEGNRFTAVVATIRIGVPFPFLGSPDCSDPELGGSLVGSQMQIHVYENDSLYRVAEHSIPVSKDPIRAVVRQCEDTGFPFYWMHLKVEKDLVTDPDGRLWDIRFAFQQDEEIDGDTDGWDIITGYSSDVLICGQAGFAADLLPGATLGPAGGLFFGPLIIQNLGEYCGADEEAGADNDLEVELEANCAFLTAQANTYFLSSIGVMKEARWILKKVSDDSILYDTGWIAELNNFQLDVFSVAALTPGLDVYIEITQRDVDLNESPTAQSNSVEIGYSPDAPIVTVIGLFVDAIVVQATPFSSPRVGAELTQVLVSVFEVGDTDFSDPLFYTEFEDEEDLSGPWAVPGIYELGESYIVRVVYIDELGCPSTNFTDYAEVAEDSETDDIPGQSCPDWGECVVGSEATWNPCSIGEAVVWSQISSGEASWSDDCASNDVC